MGKHTTFSNVNPNGINRDLTPEEEALIVSNTEASRVAKEAKDAEDAEKDALKASAKAKLIAGEALTEAEANTIVL